MAVKQNLIAGFDLGFTHGRYEPSVTAVQHVNTYGVGVFVRRYKELGKGFYLFGQARVGLSYGTAKLTDTQQALNSSSQKVFSTYLGFYPGISYTLSKKLQVEAGFSNFALIRYDHSTQSYSNNAITNSSDSFLFSSSLSNFAGPTIGLQVLLN